MSNREICPQEPIVLASRESGNRSAALSQHLKTCASCQDALETAKLVLPLAEMRLEKQPPDADVIWVMAQISKPRKPWTFETWKAVSALAASAAVAASSWSAIAGYVSRLLPPPAMAMAPMIASCIAAAGLAVAAVAANRFLICE